MHNVMFSGHCVDHRVVWGCPTDAATDDREPPVSPGQADRAQQTRDHCKGKSLNICMPQKSRLHFQTVFHL